ncbi:hypothetical protein N9M63_00330 [Candidatus Pelagibacter bacterium]|nr:hypothetical protein [Candidatus Pelagibacter bacterium]
MKKLLSIVVLGLLLSGNAYAENLILECNFKTRDFISNIFIDIKGDISLLDVKTNFTVKKYTSWKVKTIYEDNYIIIGKYYNGEPYLKINRYNLDVFYNDHQRNDHNGKCKKLKKAI